MGFVRSVRTISAWLRKARKHWILTVAVLVGVPIATLVIRGHDAIRNVVADTTHDLITRIVQWQAPYFLLAVVTLSVLAGYALDGFWRWYLSRFDASKAADEGEFHGAFFGVIGVIYAVVLAFVVVTAWQEFDHTEEVSMLEQNNVKNLLLLTTSYLHVVKDTHERQLVLDATDNLLRYTDNIRSEWLQMQRGERLCNDSGFFFEENWCFSGEILRRDGHIYDGVSASAENNAITSCVAADLASTSPDTDSRREMRDASLQIVDQIYENRDHRRHHYDEHVRAILWWVLILGAVLTISATYFGSLLDPVKQRRRTLALSVMVGMMLAVSLVFDHPFTGSLAIGMERWDKIGSMFSQAGLEVTSPRGWTDARTGLKCAVPPLPLPIFETPAPSTFVPRPGQGPKPHASRRF